MLFTYFVTLLLDRISWALCSLIFGLCTMTLPFAHTLKPAPIEPQRPYAPQLSSIIKPDTPKPNLTRLPVYKLPLCWFSISFNSEWRLHLTTIRLLSLYADCIVNLASANQLLCILYDQIHSLPLF